MTMAEIKKQMDSLNAKITEASTSLAAAAMDESVTMEDVTKQQEALAGLTNRANALRTAYEAQRTDLGETLPLGSKPEKDPSLTAMLKSNEYARAFAFALRNGIAPKRGQFDDRCKVLYDALTIGGGNPEGEDGGFLVPEDIDHNIREQRRALDPLSNIFNVEAVASQKGWRVMDKAPTLGMTALDSEVPTAGVPQDDQPKFVKVPFALTTYGLIIPVSAELAADEVANLFGYLSRWFARKQIITENLLLKAELETLTATALTTGASPDVIGQLKGVLNKALDPSISVNAHILTNQSGFDYLDQQVDATGRPMLQPDPTSGTPMLLKTRPVKMVSDALLPLVGGKAPIYIGDMQQFATLFMRQHMEIVSTDIGGNAFHTNSIEVRGIARMTTAKFDEEAAVLRTLALT